MKVVVLVPWRSDGGRRDELWAFTRGWLDKHHPDWPIWAGSGPEGPFNRGAAINDAADLDDWDVAVVHDADTICDPATLRAAVQRAHETKGCVFPFNWYYYLDKRSTDRIMSGDYWFITPEERKGQGTIIQKEFSSGVQVLAREAYDKVGGFPELTGWGFEDSIMGVLLKTFTPAPHYEWLPGGAYHLFHSDDTGYRKVHGPANRQILADVMALSVLPEQLRQYLKDGGHPI